MTRRPIETERREAAAVVDIPHDVVNEQVMLAAAFADEEIRNSLVEMLSADLFVDERHAALWGAMRAMRARRLEWSVQTLHQMVGQHGVELEYIIELQKAYPSPPANMTHHVTILRWDKARADSVKGPLSELLEALRDPSTPPERVRALGRAVAACYEVKLDGSFMRDPRVLANDAMLEIERRREVAVYPYGIDGLDVDEEDRHRMIPGVAPKKITVVTGVSGSCKSTICAKIGLEQARRKRRVLYGAWEMEPEEVIELMAMMSMGLDRYRMMTGQLTQEELDGMHERMERIGSYVKFFDPPFQQNHRKRYTNDDALDVVHGHVKESGAEVVIFDLWERILVDGEPSQERRALWRQQQMAKDTDTHCILVCQQKSKEIEERADKHPTRSTILGSSAWVDIADTILGLYRPSQWKFVEDATIEVDVLKQRYGQWPMRVEFDWDGNLASISDGRTVRYESPTAPKHTDSDLAKFIRNGR